MRKNGSAMGGAPPMIKRGGLHSARARGRIGGRPKTNADSVKKAVMLYHSGQYSIREIEELIIEI